jgi:AcrR family transcriptional regulator
MEAKEDILRAVIEGYRETVSQRYQYQRIKANYELPETVDKELVDAIRSYFLNYIYPDFEKRAELNDAFESLDNYIKQPEKLLRILMDSVKLIFSHGRHLPKILTTGLKALRTFIAASQFEESLVKEAVKNNVKAPFDSSKIDGLVALLSRKEINDFIEGSQSLFETLHNRVLVEKIKEVLEQLISNMRGNPASYSSSEVKGLEIGLEMISEGDALFNKLTKEDQQRAVHLIIDIEKDNLSSIFGSEQKL